MCTGTGQGDHVFNDVRGTVRKAVVQAIGEAGETLLGSISTPAGVYSIVAAYAAVASEIATATTTALARFNVDEAHDVRDAEDMVAEAEAAACKVSLQNAEVYGTHAAQFSTQIRSFIKDVMVGAGQGDADLPRRLLKNTIVDTCRIVRSFDRMLDVAYDESAAKRVLKGPRKALREKMIATWQDHKSSLSQQIEHLLLVLLRDDLPQIKTRLEAFSQRAKG